MSQCSLLGLRASIRGFGPDFGFSVLASHLLLASRKANRIMGIYYQSTVIGEVRAQQVGATPGIGAIQLRFVLEWSIHPKRDQDFGVFGTFVRVDAAVEGSADFVHLGHALPEVAWTEQARVGIPYRSSLIYNLTLPLEQLVALEAKRQNHGLAFQLQVRGNAFGKDGIHTLDETLILRASLGDWLRVLADGGVTDTLLVGLPLPTNVQNSALAAPLALVRSAHRHLQNGLYDACIAECRRAMDSLWAIAGIKSAATKARGDFARKDDREAQGKFERTLVVGEALRSFTHPAHHVGEDGEPEIFSRLDATLALATTSALVGTLTAQPHPASEDNSKDTP